MSTSFIITNTNILLENQIVVFNDKIHYFEWVLHKIFSYAIIPSWQKGMIMLKKLLDIEKTLPSLLHEEGWNSVYVDYHKPYVRRLWRQLGENRLYLHQITGCAREESLLHPHPWPSAMKVIKGQYEMGVGYSDTSIAPPIASTLILPVGSYYEMTHIHSWHYVRPILESAENATSFSLMITGKPWQRSVPKSSYPLRELNEHEKKVILGTFIHSYQS